MKVILLQDIRGTGKKEQVVEVADGYARNYLLPRKLAREATKEALNAIEKAKSAQKFREETAKAEAEAKARELKGKVVILKVRAGEGGKLYGSVTTEMIAQALKEQHDCEIDKRKIETEEPIRTLGQAAFTVKLVAGVQTRMLLNVVADK
ncbi:MAG: 50S ribosomal protein L9 [Christensenellales bacterium]|jgi:large subunit ribosomal protein L9